MEINSQQLKLLLELRKLATAEDLDVDRSPGT